MFRFRHVVWSVLGFAITATGRSLEDPVYNNTSNSTERVTTVSRSISFEQKRRLHGALMTIVFMVLFPIGALSIHLPLKVRIVPHVHASIQAVGTIVALLAVALGISLTSELGFWNPLRAHVVVGILVTGTIFFIQPALGIVQHQYFERARFDYANRRAFGIAHRWVGRGAVVLGMINSGLGFQLVGVGTNVDMGLLMWNFALMGIFATLWLSLVLVGFLRRRRERRLRAEPRMAEATSALS
ncbi:hypothetical protein GX51_04771 [Blastomyces parvus]|uniref:Cytochrome b561 domain-containing protein n=1 Tax=Blastomyces parvus TaxID=2060905 RepID=A0A2B7X056_9EURO|nr:hypothetical protein GX51_04771 [Blastomyces parvus]